MRAHLKLRQAWLSLGTGVFLTLLAGCGGGDGASAANALATAARNDPTARALATAQSRSGANAATESTGVAPPQAPTIIRLEQISATRVDRTRYDYVFALHVKGSGVHIKDGAFTGTTTGAGTQVLDGYVFTPSPV